MDVTILKDVSLVPYNTLRLASMAAVMEFPHSVEGLIEFIERRDHDSRIVVIGKGSNMLLSREAYAENYLFINLKLMDHIQITEGGIDVQAGATLSNLSWYAVENNIRNVEFLEDIPGTVGGAILMNAGTYQNAIGDLIGKVCWYDLNDRCLVERKPVQGDFGKRISYWAGGSHIVISCSVKCEQGDYLESMKEVLQIKEDRFRKQPRNYPNAGSVFVRPKKGPEGIQVWRMIDHIGLRGFGENGAAFSEKHPGFIINRGGATYQDIVYIIEIAKEKVWKAFGVELELEWKVI